MPPRSVKWPYPGKVLIVDDKYDDDIDLAVSELAKSGIPVQYWDPWKKKDLTNVRVILLDIILRPTDELLTGSNRYANAITALSKIRGAPIVIILSHTNDSPEALIDAVREKLKHYPGIISKERLSKRDLQTRPEKLISTVSKSLTSSPLVELVLAWEGVVDAAKDDAIQSIAGDGSAVVKTFLKILKKQSGAQGLRREFVDTAIRILSRYAHEGSRFDKLGPILESILAERVAITKETSEEVLSLLMYYDPGSEDCWTGDIFFKSGSNIQYAIVLTPACDFAQKHPASVMMAFGFQLKEDEIMAESSILYKRHYHLKELLTKKRSEEGRVRREAEGKLDQLKKKLLKGEGFQDHLQVLRHIKSGAGFVDVCFDFEDTAVKSLADLQREGWKRVTRLDTPYVEALLQDFGEHLSRIGVPEANQPLAKLGIIAG